MRIEIWADVVCPWAYVGKRRLEHALAGVDAEVVWRPYRIDPTAPESSVLLDEALRDPAADEALRGCAPGLTPAQNRARVADIAAAEGLGPPWGAVWRANSHHAHRLLHLAYEHGGAALQDDVAERVLRAHFVEGANIGDRRTLGDLAARAGFAAGATLLAGDAGDREVRELLLVGKARGIVTSPTYVVGDRALAGAQSPEAIAAFVGAAGPGRDMPPEVRRLRWAESLLDQRDPLGALTLLRPLLAEYPDDPNVRRLAARGYYHSAQLSRALDVLERLVADAPDDSYARLMLGKTLRRAGRHDEAGTHLRIAAAMTPAYG
ncbi:DsbA family oxidoreductase [Actinocatenispora rupis]|nr:DsbA family oxidoreductase [Actinocatenispora rupis]